MVLITGRPILLIKVMPFYALTLEVLAVMDTALHKAK